jgi:hypothetical protein
MMEYHDILVRFVMRECRNAEDAVRQMIRLLPHYPDESTTHMESWAVELVCDISLSECYSVERDEAKLEALVSRAEQEVGR